jgi:sulfonate transport system substrate-binding protein
MASWRSTFKSGLIALGLLALAACHRQPSGPAELVLGDQVGLAHSKADAAGVLKDVPYRIRWANFAGAAPLFEAMNAGAVDTAPAGDAPLVQAAAGHVPLKIVAIGRSSGRGVGILVPPGSPIRTIADLRGKHVIVSSARGSIAQYLLLVALEQAQVPANAVTIGYMLPNEAAAAFDAGQIDAWATFGTYQATAEARGARLLRDGRGINSGLSVIAASEAALADSGKRAALADYLKRQAAAADWSRAQPDAYAALYSRQTGVPLPVARTIVSWEDPRLEPVSEAAVRQLQLVADRFYRFGVIPERVSIAPLADPTLFRGKQ